MIPELLAPAGSVETFWAGFQAGADAFYLGGSDFNARKRAKNFSPEELRDTALFCHRAGKKIYLALNTLVFDREIPALLAVLEQAEEIQADAVIVQDLGVLDLVRRHFPRLPVHASTQLFCHNSQQARFLKNQGVSRIIFPRELSVPEIKRIMETVPLEYEIFIHGAMCFSFSGTCLFSSYMFGESGNRGACRQPCRFAFLDQGRKAYPFSMRDLQTAEILPALLHQIPVTSLKIEGRLKNAAYVAETVALYRRTLDALAAGKKPGPSPAPSLGQRQTSPGYFSGGSYPILVNAETPGTIGECIGRLVSHSGQVLTLELTGDVRKGDRLNIQTGEGRRVFEATLLDFRREGKKLAWTVKDDTSKITPRSGSLMVWKTGASAPENPRRQIHQEGSEFKYIPCNLTITCRLDDGLVRIQAAGEENGMPVFSGEYPLSLSPATELAWPEGAVERVFRQVDTLPFALKKITLVWPAGFYCPLRMVKDIRRRFYPAFFEHWQNFQAARRDGRRVDVERELQEAQNALPAPGIRKYFHYHGLPGNPEVNSVPEFTVHDLSLDEAPSAAPGPTVMLRIPLFVPEAKLPLWEKKIMALIKDGYLRYLVPTYGWLERFRNIPGLELMAGPYLYAVNSLAWRFLAGQGIQRYTLSPDIPETDLGVLAGSAAARYPLRARKEILVTRLEVPVREYKNKDKTFAVLRYPDYSVVYEKPAGVA